MDKQQTIHKSGSRERFAGERVVIEKFTGGKTGELAVHLLTPDGESLTDKNIFRQQSSDEVLKTLRDALSKFGPVKPRTVPARWQDPMRGAGVQNDGSVRLALYARNTDRLDHTARPVFDSLLLARGDWSALRPTRTAQGTRFEVPEHVARLFARGLATNSDLSYLLRPADLTVARLSGEVIASTADEVRVSLSGELNGSRKHINGGEPLNGQATLAGQLILNGSGEPIELILLYAGTFNLPYESKSRPMAALIEWRSQSPSPLAGTSHAN